MLALASTESNHVFYKTTTMHRPFIGKSNKCQWCNKSKLVQHLLCRVFSFVSVLHVILPAKLINEHTLLQCSNRNNS